MKSFIVAVLGLGVIAESPFVGLMAVAVTIAACVFEPLFTILMFLLIFVSPAALVELGFAIKLPSEVCEWIFLLSLCGGVWGIYKLAPIMVANTDAAAYLVPAGIMMLIGSIFNVGEEF